MNRKKLDLTRHAPPGYDLKAEKGLFFAGMVLSILYSLFAFGNRFSNHLAELYWINGSTKTLKAGAIMPDFVEILDGTLVGFFVLSACFLAQIAAHYVYHYQGSKSIYTMRRLPSRWELHRRCLTLPVLAAAIFLIMAFAILLIFYAVYMNVTPDVCLTPGQWQKIWSV